MKMVGEHYRDFGPTLASEKLSERHGIKLCVESTRPLMMAAGYWQPRTETPRCASTRCVSAVRGL